jgi:rod shape determining protein RodA
MALSKIDWVLVIPSTIILAIGILVLRSVAPDYVSTQLIFVLISIVAFVVFSNIDFEVLLSLHNIIYIFSLVFLLIPFLFGDPIRGTHRWISLGQSTLQPSEIIKPFLLIVFSCLTVKKGVRSFFRFIIQATIPIVIILAQPDLGTALVLLVGTLICLFFRLNSRQLIALGLGIMVFIPVSYQYILRDYQRERINTFISPYSDPLGNGYHVIQSTIAVGSGKLFGRGLGQGTQSQLRFLPERHTDFIFASLTEELGFAGGIIILAGFFVIFWRIYRLYSEVQSIPAGVFCLASGSLIAFQAFVNIGMNVGIVPVTGITLPLLSYGGSSLLSMGATLGILNSISAHSRKNNKDFSSR